MSTAKVEVFFSEGEWVCAFGGSDPSVRWLSKFVRKDECLERAQEMAERLGCEVEER